MPISETEKDIGRKVIYTDRTGRKEEGIITSFNKWYIFVRYNGDNHSKATNRSVLEFSNDPPSKPKAAKRATAKKPVAKKKRKAVRK